MAVQGEGCVRREVERTKVFDVMSVWVWHGFAMAVTAVTLRTKTRWRQQQATVRTMVTDGKTAARTKLHIHEGWNYKNSTKIREKEEDRRQKEKDTKEANIRRLPTSAAQMSWWNWAAILSNNTTATTTKHNCVHTRWMHYTARPWHDTSSTYRQGTDCCIVLHT